MINKQADSRKLQQVDQICIDQQNKTEVNSQILLMRQIYENAMCTHIDLGEIQPEWYSGFDLLHRLTLAYLSRERIKRMPASLVQEYLFPPADHISWSCYFYVFTSSWFRRTWVIQETLFSKAKLVMLGRFTFRWDYFQYSVIALAEHRFHMNPYMLSHRGALQGLQHYSWLDIIRRELQQSSTTLLQIMRLTRNFLVSDLRDKVMAVLGLFGDKMVGFEPDYTLKTEKVYTQFGAHLIKLEEGIDMLSYAGTSR